LLVWLKRGGTADGKSDLALEPGTGITEEVGPEG
jgi:hypothetical protein